MVQRRNLITDVKGIRVGNAHDASVMSGVTVLLTDKPAVAAVDARGGGLGTRETDALAPAGTVGEVHGLVLSGGSAFGLNAATGVQAWLAARGIGFQVRSARVPIVPQAILFDLLNGGDKAWGRSPPYEAMAWTAADAAAHDFALGSHGAGFGATTATLRGGLGSASTVLDDGSVVGALAAVNPAGCVSINRSAHFWSAPFEHDGEFGGRGWPDPMPASAHTPVLKSAAGESTVLAIVATSAALTRGQAMRLAIMAQTGLTRAVYPVHTPLDGDIVFAVATGHDPAPDPVAGLARLGAAAAVTLARAVARGVHEAAPVPPCWQGPLSWQERFGRTRSGDAP